MNDNELIPNKGTDFAGIETSYDYDGMSISARVTKDASGDDDGRIDNSTMTVNFKDAEQKKMLNDILYPRKKRSNSSPISRQDYGDLFARIATVRVAVNGIMAQLKYMFINAPSLEAQMDSGQVREILDKNWAAIEDSFSAKKQATSVIANMVEAALSHSYIIKPSKRFKGGMDILYIGAPTPLPVEANSVVDNLRDLTSISLAFTTLVAESKYAEVSMSLLAALNKWLFEKPIDLKTTQADRPWVLRKIDSSTFDLKVLQSELDRIMSAANMGTFWTLPSAPGLQVTAQAMLPKMFSYLVVREPNASTLYASSSVKPDDELSDEGKQAFALSSKFSVSVAISLTEEMVNVITQTDKGKQVPLVALDMWAAIWSRGMLYPHSIRSKGNKILRKDIPRFIIMPSQMMEIQKRRAEQGLMTEETRANEDSLFVAGDGRFNFCPPSGELAVANAKTYEKIQEDLIRLTYEAEAPISLPRNSIFNKMYQRVNADYETKLPEYRDQTAKFAGSLQTYSWDFNTILTTSQSDPTKLVQTSLVGASRPDDLALSEYLKMNANKATQILFTDDFKKREESYTISPEMFANSTLIEKVLKTYSYLYAKNKVPDLQTLVQRAARAMDITTLGYSVLKEGDQAAYDVGLYDGTRRGSVAYLTRDLKVFDQWQGPKIPTQPVDPMVNEQFKAGLVRQNTAIRAMLNIALEDASAAPGSNLIAISIKNNTPFDEDPHYFAFHNGQFSDIKNVFFNYLGGRIFFEMLQSISKTDIKDLVVVDPKLDIEPVPFNVIVRSVMPFVTMVTKYVPNSSEIVARGDALESTLHEDSSIDVSDIHFPGSREGMSLFPHQNKSFKTLGRFPRFAALDIAPGGGKTILGLIDIGNLIHAGLIKKACVICPNNLVRNWIEDLHLNTNGKWNVIPLTTATYRTWGNERLTELIKKAPINTIFVVGISFLQLDKRQVVIGTFAQAVSGTLEFCRKFNFDYVILDESHKAKNEKSYTHKAIKQLTTASSVKYVRIATGSLIHNKLADIVGQSALFGAHIFRTVNEYIEENSDTSVGGAAITFKKDTPYLARKQLARHAAVLTYKRRDWAFMLPRPIESFFAVSLGGADEENVDANGLAHQAMYDAVLKETLDSIKKDPKIMGMFNGKTDDDDDSDDDVDDDDVGTDENDNNTVSSSTERGGLKLVAKDKMDDSTLESLEELLNPYLARLEMLLTDPMGDEFGERFMTGAGMESYVSRKVRKVIERIKLNFQEFPWKKGEKFGFKSITDYKGTRYVLMAAEGKETDDETYREQYVSTIEPDRDPRWQPEPLGKVIVFCRYTRSVNAVYKALPPELKKLAVLFTSGVKNKYQNLEDFRTTPYSTEKGAQILIANEQAISEGHNLQMANRIIRVESPWSPGELDQSSSRIFRPDTTGKFRRENVYLDWVLCNNTLEVAKMGRLISRILDKTKFDEANNPRYDVLAEYDELYPISMSLENIQAVPRLSDIQDYVEAYTHLVEIQSTEFAEMRQTMSTEMVKMDPTEMPKGSEILESVPYVSGLKFVPDRHNYGLTKLTTFLNDVDAADNREVVENPKLLVGMYAHTEFGNGVIESVRRARGDEGKQTISSVSVRLANGDLYTGDPSMIYLAENITKENVREFSPKKSIATAKDKKNAERLEKERDKQQARENKRAKMRNRAIADAETQQRRVRKANVDAVKNVGKVKRTKAREAAEVQEQPKQELTLYPVVYNGFLCVEAAPNEDTSDRDMRKLGFRDFGDYAWTQIKDQQSFHALLSWLDKRFYMKPQTVNRLNKLSDSFMSGRGRKFAVELAPISDFKNFYTLTHKLSGKDKESGKPELKIYPVVINGALFLNVDLSTNPVFRKYLNKTIPGTKSLKFQEADGLWIQFFRTRNEVVAWTKSAIANGLVIENLDEYRAEVDKLRETLKQMQKLTK